MDECKGDKKQMKVSDALYKWKDLRACPEFKKPRRGGEKRLEKIYTAGRWTASIFQSHKKFKSLLKSVNAVYM